jgi:bacillithiol biosynthesis cysteine-adding enzyme BshC
VLSFVVGERPFGVTELGLYHLTAMHCRALPIENLPHQPQLLRDYLNSYQNVAPFFQHKPDLESVLRVAKSLDYPADRRKEVAAVLRQQNELLGSGAATTENLRRFENGAVAVVSGQQVGLFSGPAYAAYKALSAVRIAKELTEHGVEAVPVFWMATEDHDLDEIRHATFFSDGRLELLELPSGVGSGAPVGRIPLGGEIEKLQSAAAGMLTGELGSEIAGILKECYQPGDTYGSAFGKLFARLLKNSGLILLDPLDLRLHRVAEPLLAKAVEERDALDEGLLARDKHLESAGYAPQVKVTARSTILFHISRDGRQAITDEHGTFRSGEKNWNRQELLSGVRNEPENFSPSALFRPVVQDYLLPTAAYIGGPAEISYFAQSEVIYRQLLGRMPVMLPRPGYTLVDTKAQRLLKQYGVDVEQVWEGPQELGKRMSTASLPENLSTLLQENGAEIQKRLQQWSDAVKVLDSTLTSAVETAQKKIEYQSEKLQQMIGRALDRKSGTLSGHQEFLSNLIYPRKSLQSRELCFLPFLARWGQAGLEEIERHSSIKNAGTHFIIPIP